MPGGPMMTKIHCVLGDLDPAALGVTLPHEHLLLDMSRGVGSTDGILNDVDVAIEELARFKAIGGTTIVDATNLGLGRDPLSLQRIAKATGVNVVMGSGWYRESFYPVDVQSRGVNDLAEEIIRDIEVGPEGTGIRAGVIGEIGSDRDYISGIEERVLRASARAHLHTGATITTHSLRCPLGLEQLDLLAEERVDATRVIIGHCDLYPNPEYHLAVAERGAWVEFDRISGKFDYEVRRRIRLIHNLIEHGRQRQLLLSHDVCLRSDLRTYGGTGYDYLLTDFVELLRGAGLSGALIEQIIIDNPRRALTGAD